MANLVWVFFFFSSSLLSVLYHLFCLISLSFVRIQSSNIQNFIFVFETVFQYFFFLFLLLPITTLFSYIPSFILFHFPSSFINISSSSSFLFLSYCFLNISSLTFSISASHSCLSLLILGMLFPKKIFIMLNNKSFSQELEHS